MTNHSPVGSPVFNRNVYPVNPKKRYYTLFYDKWFKDENYQDGDRNSCCILCKLKN